MKLFSLTLGLVFALLLLPSSVSAQMVESPQYCPPKPQGPPQTIRVQGLDNYLPRYKGQYKLIERRVDEHPVPTERPALLDSLVKALGEEFRLSREGDYRASQVKILVKHHCNAGRGWPGHEAHDCGWVFAYSPDTENMYTTPEWLCYTGTQKGIEISNNGRTAGLKMTRQTRGVNRGGIHVLFKYTPEAITSLAEKDWKTLYGWISSIG